MQKPQKYDMAIAERMKLKEQKNELEGQLKSMRATLDKSLDDNERLRRTNSDLVNKLNSARFELARERGMYDPARSTSPFIKKDTTTG